MMDGEQGTGKYVHIADTVRSFREILEGKHDGICPNRRSTWSAPSKKRGPRPRKQRHNRVMSDEKTFPFEILTLQKQFLPQQVRFVIAPGQEGVFEVLANHAPFVFALKPGPLRLRLPDDQDQYVAVGSGFLVVQKERTTVLTRSAERPEEIDVDRARKAKERAEQRLQQKSPDIDLGRAKAALQRALARLPKVADYAVAAK